MKTFVVDLDHTICTPQDFPDTERRYAHAAPIVSMIAYLRIIAPGNRIIIHTARRMLTHRGDLAKIEDDVGQVTREWLARHNVPYDELIFGKPMADFYIDDKAVNVNDKQFFDAAHQYQRA